MSLVGYTSTDETPAAKAALDQWKHRLRTTRGRRTKDVLGDAWQVIGMSGAVTPLHRILRARDDDRDIDERTAALQALGILADPIGLFPAFRLVEDGDADLSLRIAAAIALARGGAWAIPALTAALADRYPAALRLAAARSLLGAGPHQQAAAVVLDLVSDDTDRTHRRLRSLADLALGNTASVARRGLDGVGWPEVSAWALAKDRERALLNPDDIVLRILAADDEISALEAPALAIASPDRMATALDDDWNPDDPRAGKTLWLAGLLGSAGRAVLARWARHPQAPAQVHRLAGMAGTPNTGHPSWAIGQALLQPAGNRFLEAQLGLALETKDVRRLVQALHQHHVRWGGSGAELAHVFGRAAAAAQADARSHLIWGLGELGRDAHGHEDLVTANYPHDAFSAWALGEIGSARALHHLRALPIPQGNEPWAVAARGTLAFACLMHGIKRGPLGAFGPTAARENYAWRYALLADEQALTPPGRIDRVEQACLSLVRNGLPWRGPSSAADLDEAAILLAQTGYPAHATLLLAAIDDDEVRRDLLERINGELRPMHATILAQAIADLKRRDEDSLALRWLTGIAGDLTEVVALPIGLPAAIRRRLALGLRLLHAGPDDAGAAFGILGAPLEDLARHWLENPCDRSFAGALAQRFQLKRPDLAIEDKLTSDGERVLREILTWIEHPEVTDSSGEGRILRKGLAKLARLRNDAWKVAAGSVSDVLDGLGSWTAALVILHLGAQTRGLPPHSQGAATGFLIFQRIRNQHVHHTLPMTEAEALRASHAIKLICGIPR